MRRQFVRPLMFGFCILPLACSGIIGGPEKRAGAVTTGATSSNPVNFTCDETAVPSETPLRRLSKLQYENTVSDLLTQSVGATNAASLLADATPLYAQIPDDLRVTVNNEKHGGFRRLDQSLQQAHVNGTLAVAQQIATDLTSTQAMLSALLGSCATTATASGAAACVGNFIDSFGLLSQRRPLEADDHAFYVSVYDDTTTAGINPAALNDVIVVFLTAPNFLYNVESGAAPIDDNYYALDPYELASRLSYQFWDTMPDAALFAAAADGSISTSDGFAAQLTRVYTDPKTTGALDNFYNEWLSLEDRISMVSLAADPVFDAITSGFPLDANTTPNMVNETIASVRYYAQKADGTFEDIFTSTKSFATTADVAAIYQTPIWDGQSEPPEMTQAERMGLLTRAVVVSTGGEQTRPVQKGVFIREGVLCDTVPPPPPGVNTTPPAPNTDETTRQQFEALTERPGTICAGCHATLLNPLGFITENFDPIGRYRSAQTLFDTSGNYVTSLPVDTSAQPQVDSGDTTTVSKVADLVPLMLASEKPQACFSRRYFRFVFSRQEDVAQDGCFLGATKGSIDSQESLGSILQSVASQPQFQRKHFD